MRETDTRILTVVAGLNDLLVADEEFLELIDGEENFFERYTYEGAELVRGVYWYTLPRTREENTESCVVRYEVLQDGTARAIATENRIVAIAHSPLPRVINGVGAFTQFRQSIDLNDEGRTDERARRVVEILIQPVRQGVGG